MNIVLTGVVDGVNTTFTAARAFASGSAWLNYNGRGFPPTDAVRGLTESSNLVVVLTTPPSTNGNASGANGTVDGADYVYLEAEVYVPTTVAGTATFDPALSRDSDKVRAKIGDTRGLAGSTTPYNVTKALLFDATINAVIATNVNTGLNMAAAECAEMCMAMYGHQPSTGDMDLHLGAERFEFMQKLAKQLRGQSSAAAVNRASFDVGGRTIAERDTLAQDDGLVQPKVRKGQDDYPGTTEDTGPLSNTPRGL